VHPCSRSALTSEHSANRKYSLAWTELYLTMGMMFRRFKFEIFEADKSDVKMAHDFFIPVAKLDSKGVRVFVTSTTD